MNTRTEIHAADLTERLKLQFCMVAQTASDFFAANGENQPFRFSAVIDGKTIVAIVGVDAINYLLRKSPYVNLKVRGRRGLGAMSSSIAGQFTVEHRISAYRD